MGEDYQKFDGTEIWNNGQSQPHVRLPVGMWGHRLTSLNNTHILLTGGETQSGTSTHAFIYSEGNGFTRIADMRTPRCCHASSVINDTTVVVGGYTSYGEERSAEYLDLTSLTWT